MKTLEYFKQEEKQIKSILKVYPKAKTVVPIGDASPACYMQITKKQLQELISRRPAWDVFIHTTDCNNEFIYFYPTN